MPSLRQKLLQEQNRLEKILSKVKNELKDAPQGTLRLSKSRTNPQYYHCVPEERKKGIYISKTNENLIHQLAQKSYDERVCKVVERRLLQIRKILKDYSDDEIEKIFLKEHPARRKFIRPIEPTWEQQLNHWINEPYERKEFQENDPYILTEQGERVRSKSEKIMAEYFYRNGIPFKYECPLHLKGFGTVYPDFTFLSPKTRKEIYWEHDGRMDDPAYAKNAIRKIDAYEKNGIYLGERLILTFETEQSILSTQAIERKIKKYII